VSSESLQAIPVAKCISEMPVQSLQPYRGTPDGSRAIRK